MSNQKPGTEEGGAGIGCGELPRLLIQEVLLPQIFQNLLANAVKWQDPEPPMTDVTASRQVEMESLRER